MTATAIRIQGLSKQYNGTSALSSVDLALDAAEMFGLIGPDGAGKTTLMRILVSLLDPDQGTCHIHDISVQDRPADIRQMIGYMPQRFSLYPDLTVGENLRFFADLFQVPRSERISRTNDLLAFSRLTSFVDRRAGALSGGMKQKLALSCALVHTPRVLVLDEPTTGVDPVSRREFWAILGKLKQDGTTILVSTPYMDEAAQCDRIALMHRGNILATGKAPEIARGFSGTVYAIRAADSVAAANWFKKKLGPEQVRIVRNHVRISLFGDDNSTMGDLRRQAASAGIKIKAADTVDAGLEDVFVAMIAAQTAIQAD